MTEYKYTKHIWTKDDDFVWPAERALAYMAFDTGEALLNTYTACQYNLLDTPQERFSYLIARLVDRTAEYFNVTDPDLWDSSLFQHIQHTVSDTTAMETLTRLMFIFRHGLYLRNMERGTMFADSDRRYIMFEVDPVSMFLHPRAYTLEGISTTVHSNVFGGDSIEFVPWDGTGGTAWLATDFSFELFTLISRTLKHVLFSVRDKAQHI